MDVVVSGSAVTVTGVAAEILVTSPFAAVYVVM
jgi:hypothetical protein